MHQSARQFLPVPKTVEDAETVIVKRLSVRVPRYVLKIVVIVVMAFAMLIFENLFQPVLKIVVAVEMANVTPFSMRQLSVAPSTVELVGMENVTTTRMFSTVHRIAGDAVTEFVRGT